MEKDIKSTIDYKQAHIKANMDAKEESIFISGSSRMATDIVTTFYQKFLTLRNENGEPLEDRIEKTWEHWQQYFYNYMKSQMPEMPTCATCGGQMKISSKGNWYCPNWKDEAHQVKPHKFTPQEEAFNNSLK